jgi:hypothetical protein
MKFISRHANLKVVIRPTIKHVSNNQSGSEEVVKYPPVIIEFRGGIFDTSRWKEYDNPEIPEKFNIIQSEEDLIKQLTKNPFFNTDFSELKVESTEDKRARLLHELSKLDAESGVTPSNSPEIDQGATIISKDEVNTKPKGKGGRPKGKGGRPPKNKTIAKPNKDSVIDL